MMPSYLARFTTFILLPFLISPTYAQLTNITTPSLNLTAISASNGSSILECWQFPGFASSNEAGTSGALSLFLGEAANVSYMVIPGRFDGGVHRAPVAQLVFFASGLAHITLPNTTESSTTSAWIQGGKYGLIVAADTADVSTYGHITTYPSDADSVSLEVPFAGGVVPEHVVLHEGPCTWGDQTGL